MMGGRIRVADVAPLVGSPPSGTSYSYSYFFRLQVHATLFTVKERLSCTTMRQCVTNIVGTYHGRRCLSLVNQTGFKFSCSFFFQERRAKGGPLKETAHDFLQRSEFFCRNESLFAAAVVDKSIRSWDGMMSHWKNTDVDFIGDMTDASIVRPHTGNRGGLSLHECVTTCPPLFRRVHLLVAVWCQRYMQTAENHATKSNSPFHVR